MARVLASVTLVLAAAACAACAACATAPATPAPPSDDIKRARAETVELLRRSLLQRWVREAPAIARGGIAKLVTLVPLDSERVTRLAPAVSRTLHVERLENDVALRLEAALSADELRAFEEALRAPAVVAVVDAAVASDPETAELERFVEDPASLPEPRRARIKALVDATWSPVVVDRLTRAPVGTAGRSVAAALADDETVKRDELLRIAGKARPGDADALVVAFAFLWRNIGDEDVDAAAAWFASDAGRRARDALIDAAVGALDDIANEIEREVREGRRQDA